MVFDLEHEVGRELCHLRFTSVSGHLMQIDFAEGACRQWSAYDPQRLFEARIAEAVSSEAQDIVRTLKRESRGARKLIIWTDCDREGEKIGYEIVAICQQVVPHIEVLRAHFSAVTQRDVDNALTALTQPDPRLAMAVEARTELDLRIGAAFTRFQTLYLRKYFPELRDRVISYGPCQFPTLGFVVRRYWEIGKFVSEDFWRIHLAHRATPTGPLTAFTWLRQRVFNENACAILYDICMAAPTPRATVVEVKSQPRSLSRPLPLNTVEMQKMAARKLHMTSEGTMRIAEKLYTAGYISYPRTETDRFGPGLDLVQLVKEQESDPRWGDFARRLLPPAGQPTPRAGRNDDKAHPPIHPTKAAAPGVLHGDEARLYEYITRRFLAVCSSDALTQQSIVVVDVAAERFTASGTCIVQRNYLDVYPYEVRQNTDLPPLRLHERFEPTVLEMQRGETSPPQLLTEADLIALMDKNGIGTDATIAEHIGKIKEREYIGVVNEKYLAPSSLGIALCLGYETMGLEMAQPSMRAGLEADLKRICSGECTKDDVIRTGISLYQRAFTTATKESTKLAEAVAQYMAGNGGAGPGASPSEGRYAPFSIASTGSAVAAGADGAPDGAAHTPYIRPCGKCASGQMLLRRTRNGDHLVGCSDYPTCRNAVFMKAGVVSSARPADAHCAACEGTSGGQPVLLVEVVFERGAVPLDTPTPYRGCISGRCDSLLSEIFNIRPAQRGSNEASGVLQQAPSSSAPDAGHGRRHVAEVQHADRVAGRGDAAAADEPFQPYDRHSPVDYGRSARPDMDGSVTAVLPCAGRQAANGGFTRSRAAVKPEALPSASMQLVGRAIQAPPCGNSRTGPIEAPGNEANSESAILCGCGRPAAKRVSKTPTNPGRQFYTCANAQQADRCSFFLWADMLPSSTDAERQPLWGGQSRAVCAHRRACVPACAVADAMPCGRRRPGMTVCIGEAVRTITQQPHRVVYAMLASRYVARCRPVVGRHAVAAFQFSRPRLYTVARQPGHFASACPRARGGASSRSRRRRTTQRGREAGTLCPSVPQQLAAADLLA